jgi:hypothetical protein
MTAPSEHGQRIGAPQQIEISAAKFLVSLGITSAGQFAFHHAPQIRVGELV